jgi:hypothetical protein
MVGHNWLSSTACIAWFLCSQFDVVQVALIGVGLLVCFGGVQDVSGTAIWVVLVVQLPVYTACHMPQWPRSCACTTLEIAVWTCSMAQGRVLIPASCLAQTPSGCAMSASLFTEFDRGSVKAD